MAQSFSKIYLHIVFATKDRTGLITPALEAKLFPYIYGIARNIGAELRTINGTTDHIHMLVDLSPAVSVSEFVKKIKANSSR